ncbi:MAG TPA: transketolase [Bacteroidales bacterium]|jgi:transketolase|nr:transketolase [Bacteroidales bacterium]
MENSIEHLRNIARSIRIWVIKSLAEAGSGHLGGSLGLADVFTMLYFNVLKHDSQNPAWPGRDRFILSIGHVAPVFYSTLAHAGYFPPEELLTLRKLGSRLQGHPGKEHGLPGIELSAGSLGQGLSVSVGLSLGFRLDGLDNKVYCLLGDGELQEGSVWEAAMAAGHYHLNHLIAIVDRNGLQIDGSTEKVMRLEPLRQKWEAFGWEVTECDGNNMEELSFIFGKLAQGSSKPQVVIAKTVMGKGVSAIEGDYRWHGKAPTRAEAERFIEEILNI